MIRSLASSHSASDASFLEEACIWLAIISGIVLVLGLTGEWPESEPWKTSYLYKLAKAAVILGVAGELFGDAGIFAASGRLQQITDDSIRENFRIEKAIIDQLKPRDFKKWQFDALVSALDGKVKLMLTVFTIPDPEASRFGFAILQLLQAAHVDTRWVRLKENFAFIEGVSSTGITLYAPDGSKPGLKELVETLLNQTTVENGLLIHAFMGKATPDIPVPSLFVMQQERSFEWFPSYLGVPGVPEPPLEPKIGSCVCASRSY